MADKKVGKDGNEFESKLGREEEGADAMRLNLCQRLASGQTQIEAMIGLFLREKAKIDQKIDEVMLECYGLCCFCKENEVAEDELDLVIADIESRHLKLLSVRDLAVRWINRLSMRRDRVIKAQQDLAKHDPAAG